MMTQMITASKTPRAITVIGYCLLVIVLASCSGDGSQMRAQLEELERQNRADSVMTNDSLAEHLVKYFDRHGTANERMRAHYILGRTYADIGEAPRAVDAYLDAASQADTTAADCDYRTLSAVYSQMADVLHRQLLLSEEIEARKHSYHFAVLNGKPIIALSEKKLSASAYILLNKRDSAEMFLKEVIRQYEELGYTQEGIQASTMLMHLYIEIPEKKYDLGHLIDRYDKESNMFDEKHELHSKMRLFYYYKGKYYEDINRLDSAEFYYRKVYHPEIAFVAQNSMYKGLLNVFQKRHEADSIAKYAQLYCMVNDSSIALNDRQTTAQMAASYNYNRFQRQAFENEMKADRERFQLYYFFLITFILAIAGIYAFFRYKRKKHMEIESMKSQYAEATEKYYDNLHSIDVLRNAHKQVISIIQQELHDAKDESSKYAEKYQKAQATISDINNQYEADILELKTENERFQDTIKQLKQCKDLTSFVENSKAFFESDIVKSITQNAQKSIYTISNDEWHEFLDIVGKHYPNLVSNLNALQGITHTKIRVCTLTILKLRTEDIAHLLDIFPQRVTNIKGELNKDLFGDSSARTLYPNLVQRYNILA
jgi:hypothetical protein